MFSVQLGYISSIKLHHIHVHVHVVHNVPLGFCMYIPTDLYMCIVYMCTCLPE